MSILEIAMIILSVGVILGSFILRKLTSTSQVAKRLIADYLGPEAIIKTFPASKSDKYNKQQTEVVATIVWRFSGRPLTAILKNPEHRYYIYQGLSDPNQYPWGTEESSRPKRDTKESSRPKPEYVK